MPYLNISRIDNQTASLFKRRPKKCGAKQAILLVDDEEGILVMLENLLQKEGFFDIVKTGSAAEALNAVQTRRFDMIVLDVMLPDMDGFSLCTEMRKTITTLVLFLTVRSSGLDKLRGLFLGGDDYVTKPFNPLEVIARIQAHLRRSMMVESNHKYAKNRSAAGRLLP